MNIELEDQLRAYLQPTEPRFNWVQTRVVNLLQSHEAPSLSASAMKLLQLVKDERIHMDDLEAVIELDAGLAARCIKVAGSTFYGGRPIKSINQALIMMGFMEIRRIGFAIGVVDSFSRLKIKVDWRRFWLHSMLVGRLTQQVAGAFREPTGAEYLAGLMHDIGKLVIEHDFPREFELVILRAMERNCGHAKMERDLLGIDHAQIGAAMCEVMKISTEVRNAVQHHHGDFAPTGKMKLLPDRGFLAACVSVADGLAHMGGATFASEARIGGMEELSSWKMLTEKFNPQFGLDLDLDFEIKRAEADLESLGLGAMAAA